MRANRRLAAATTIDPVTPAELAAAVATTVEAAVAAGEFAAPVPDDVSIERPSNPEHGDYATNIALRLAKPAGRPAREVAEIDRRPAARRGRHRPGRRRRSGLPEHHRSPPTRSARWRARSSRPARPTAAPTTLAGRRINLEFVSANPTGPVHLGGTRWAAVGDALARLLEAMRRVGRAGSTTSTTTARRSTGSRARCSPRAKGQPAPEDGYGGAYVGEIAAAGRRRRIPRCCPCPTTRRRRCSGARASS